MPSKQVGHPIRALENTLSLFQLNRNGSNNSRINVEFRPSDSTDILDTNLTALTSAQRLTFKVIVCMLCMLSLCGNISTFGVNLRRKMRPFFRACLISLALSDLLNTVFLTAIYFAQLSTEYVQIWVLGGLMCKLVPFNSTVAILASSLTLVVIALDRYFAVMKAYISLWKPGHISGVICMLTIWFLSLGISAPIFWIYHTISVYIVADMNNVFGESKEESIWKIESPKDNLSFSLLRNQEHVFMCVSDQKHVTLYYIIVFGIIFVPCIITFVWLNVIIAKKIWDRRHRKEAKLMCISKLKHSYPASKEINNISNAKQSTITPSSAGISPKKYNKMSSTREARHYRMVMVIILLIVIFICLRLPAWIFLLMRTYGSYTKPHDWIIYFSFGVLNLAGSALNPFFYTFLHETLQYILCCKMRCCSRRRYLQCCIGETDCGSSTTPTDTFFTLDICACCCIFCSRSRTPTCSSYNTREHRVSGEIGSIPRSVRFEKDEGVDCNDDCFNHDEDDVDNNDGVFEQNENNVSGNCNQQVFTVFSMALVHVPADLAYQDNEI